MFKIENYLVVRNYHQSLRCIDFNLQYYCGRLEFTQSVLQKRRNFLITFTKMDRRYRLYNTELQNDINH